MAHMTPSFLSQHFSFVLKGWIWSLMPREAGGEGRRGQSVCSSLFPPARVRVLTPYSPSRLQDHREGISRGTDCCATQFPLWKQPSGTSLLPAVQEEPRRKRRRRMRHQHSWAGPEQQPGPLLPTAGVQTGVGGLWESKAPQNCSLAGTNSLKFWPSVCCGMLGHVLQLVW